MPIKTYLDSGSDIKEVLHLEELKVVQTINEHATLYLTARLQEKAEIAYVRTAKSLDIIEVVTTEPAYKPIFKGVVTNIQIKQIDKAYYLIVEGLSSSYLADIEISSRSFQDGSETYTSIVNKVIAMPFTKAGMEKAERKIGDVTDNASNGAATGEFVMQYRETDWQFIKRMSSRFYHGLVPSLYYDTPSIVMGIPKGAGRGDIEKYNFVAKKNLAKYMNMTGNTEFTEDTGKKYYELDAVSFFIETSEDFEIGDTMTYQYHKPETAVADLYIRTKEIEMIDGTLRYHYELTPERGFHVPKIYNEQIVGLSLQGVVLERVQDTVKVFLEIDAQAPSPAWKFPYSTPYTAEGSSGWYVMPELEDTVNIYFPTRHENDGFGLNSIRVKGSGTDKIGNPDIKYLRTRNGKEIKLAPDEVVITCVNWSDEETGEENIIYIQLNEDNGITIQSTQPIYINSDGDIHFTADKDLTFEALEEIKLKCGGSLIKMDTAIEVKSSAVKVNG